MTSSPKQGVHRWTGPRQEIKRVTSSRASQGTTSIVSEATCVVAINRRMMFKRRREKSRQEFREAWKT
ncbi:hypothetical protein KPH14_002250 [Odynerus spinipes]|uniref:Uncharacterized protein n=1 Tax=Odynerus spinipes TaxID=1348599 RepID=A0AAD9RLB7_9HYME|nr:hypothetical protein KPH14_002250 [Odynerus spinipes]